MAAEEVFAFIVKATKLQVYFELIKNAGSFQSEIVFFYIF